MPRSSACRNVLFMLLIGLSWVVGSPPRLDAQVTLPCGNPPGAAVSFRTNPTNVTRPANCQGFLRCECPEKTAGPTYEVLPAGCQGMSQSCSVRLSVDLKVPGSAQNTFIGTHPQIYWFKHPEVTLPCSAPGCDFVAACGPLGNEILTDGGTTFIDLSGLTCNNLRQAAGAGVYSFSAYSCYRAANSMSLPAPNNCDPARCEKRLDVTKLDLSVAKLRQLLSCPPEDSCPRDAACETCLGPGSGTSAGGGPPGFAPPQSGPGASLIYKARGIGHVGFPGSATWNVELGRYWSHDYAERIVADTADFSHVWLLTRYGTFREFFSLDTSTGVYGSAAPTDEKRTLRKIASGWTLTDLEGKIQTFGTGGRWVSTADRFGNAKTATYSGLELTAVSFPDGRREEFGYDGSGRLQFIEEVGVGGSPRRRWTYTWTGLDLTRIDRPDGTALGFAYGSGFAGYLTRVDLLGTDGTSRRVLAAWDYDGAGNVFRTWRGADAYTDAGAIDKHQLAYDDGILPTTTTVTDPVGQPETFSLGRDPFTTKAKVLARSGGCPVCGSSPSATYEYLDSTNNPLLPTSRVDGRGFRTSFTYDARGMVTRRLEAVGTAEEKETLYTYNPSFPSLLVSMDELSTSGGASRRRRITTYDTQGRPANERIEGVESGGFFTYDTIRTFNAAGQVESIDPPGYGTTDQTLFTYATPGRNGLVPDTRVDPLVGTTGFEYDGWNRRTRTVDPSGVGSRTEYDPLNRVDKTIAEGAVVADDLVTDHTYNVFGDLFRTQLPAGNLVEYGYDGAGRLVTVERKLNATTPGERTRYTLDGAGNRTRQDLERWTGAAWETRSWTEFDYSTRCHVDRVRQSNGTVTEYRYDCNDNVERVWDANHPVASNPTSTLHYEYDARNRLKTVTQPWAGAGGGTAITRYGYDIQDHLTSVLDANQNRTTYVYSDRDLMTSETSPVSGVTTHVYNDHGEMISETDARPVTMTRTVDAADRVTVIDYPGTALDTTYVYGSTPALFDVGRLKSITRSSSSVNYEFDRFGRTRVDGAMSYLFDKNGNRTTMTYPSGVAVDQTFDFADRPKTSTLRDGASPPELLASNALYEPFGPPNALTLGNGLTETRVFDLRYYPESITVPGRFSWTYTVDKLGNPLSITDGLDATSSRSFSYQDHHYFLMSGTGPWGTRSFTYDRIGNRLTDESFTFTYIPNAAGQNTPKIATWGPRTLEHDAIGDVTLQGKISFSYDAAKDLSGVVGGTTNATVLSDGRGFLRLFTNTPTGASVAPTYGSEGMLYHRRNQSGASTKDTYVIYLGDRPLATYEKPSTGSPRLLYLTTDHLGTPALATSTTSALVWRGGFDVFGQDSFSGAQVAGIFLRFPGQWQDDLWYSIAGKHGEVFYNVHRWYDSLTGRYTAPDPLEQAISRTTSGTPPTTPFTYSSAAPTSSFDSIGLQPSNPGRLLSAYVNACYGDLRRRRSEAQAVRFPGVENDFVRHCTTSCEAADGLCGPQLVRLAGVGNEIQGIIIDILHHQTGAFEFEDLAFNEQGLACAAKRQRCSCEQCCRDNQLTFGLRVVEKLRRALIPLLFF